MPYPGKLKTFAPGRLVPVILALFFLAPACSGDDTASSDGDTDAVESQPDGDNSAEGDTETTDPCAELQCSPGGECLKRKNNVPYCFCNSGYHANSDFTQCLPDEADGDADKDIDWDYDVNACNPASTPWPDLPCCNTDGSGPRPCIIDLEFEYTNDIGEFTLGFRDARYLYSFDINGEKMIFVQNSETEPYKGGVKIFDYKSKTGVLIRDNSLKTIYLESGIGSTRAFYTKMDHYIVENDYVVIPANYIYSIDLNTMQSSLAEDTESNKETLSCLNDDLFWLDNRLSPETYDKHLYRMVGNGESERLDLLSEVSSIQYDISPSGDAVLYSIGSASIALKDLEDDTEKVLTEKLEEVYKPKISQKYATWYDLSKRTNKYTGCGKSLVLYDRESEQAEYFKESSGIDDHFALDLWGDWMLYYECHGAYPDNPYCCDDIADGDIYIYHFPTKKSWKLTDSPGARNQAQMYDHLIVWADGRYNPNNRPATHDIFGIDLCLHPELKDYFESCKDGAF